MDVFVIVNMGYDVRGEVERFPHSGPGLTGDARTRAREWIEKKWSGYVPQEGETVQGCFQIIIGNELFITPREHVTKIVIGPKKTVAAVKA